MSLTPQTSYTGIYKPALGTPVNHGHPAAAGLLFAALLNEGVGGRFSDTSGNGNHLALQAGTAAWTQGKYGVSFSWNGSTTYAKTGNLPFPAPSKGFAFALVLDNTAATSGCAVQFPYAKLLSQVSGGTVSVKFYDGSSTLQTLNSATSIAQGTTVAIGFSYTAGTGVASLYINGVLDNSTTGTAGMSGTTLSTAVYLGVDSGLASYFTGTVDNLFYWGVPVGAGTFLDLRTTPFGLMTASLLQTWYTNTLIDLATLYTYSGPRVPKPPMGSTVNRNHPLASGLIQAIPFNEGCGTRVKDVASGLTYSWFQANPQWVTGPFGLCPAMAGFGGRTAIGPADKAAWSTTSTTLVTNAVTASGQYSQSIFYLVPTRASTTDWTVLPISLNSGVTLNAASVPLQIFSALSFSDATSGSVGFTVAKAGWYHAVACVNLNLGTHKLYVNGQLAASTTFTAGKVIQQTGLQNQMAFGFGGPLDVPMNWNRALSAMEVAQLYAQPFCWMDPPKVRKYFTPFFPGIGITKPGNTANPPTVVSNRRSGALTKPPLGARLNTQHNLAQGLAFGLLCNEGVGHRLTDISGNGNHLNLILGTTGSIIPEATNLWGQGLFGPALKFMGFPYELKFLPTSLMKSQALANTGWSMSVWVYSNMAVASIPGNSINIWGTNDFSTGDMGFRFSVSGVTPFVQYLCPTTLSSTYSVFIGPGTSVLSGWMHLAGTWSPLTNKGTLYINGSLAGTITTTGVANPMVNNIYLGAYGSTQTPTTLVAFSGILDMPLYWTRALSAAEVTQLYTNPFCFIQKSPLMWYDSIADPAATTNYSGNTDSVITAEGSASAASAKSLEISPKRRTNSISGVPWLR